VRNPTTKGEMGEFFLLCFILVLLQLQLYHDIMDAGGEFVFAI
jgi:hypothetical protein